MVSFSIGFTYCSCVFMHLVLKLAKNSARMSHTFIFKKLSQELQVLGNLSSTLQVYKVWDNNRSILGNRLRTKIKQCHDNFPPL